MRGNITLALKQSGQSKARIEIANLHRQLGTSMVYVTHEQTEAVTLADKVVVLRDGRIEQIGSPMELYNNPANKFVAGFLGSPSMNFFPAGMLKDGDDRTVGVRPENLFLDDNGAIDVQVSHVEKLGGDTNIIAQVNSHQITVRLFGQHEVEPGQDLRLGFDPKSAYHFGSEGARI